MGAPASRVRSRSGGFTLIELLIVVVIIGILAAIAIPQFTGTKDVAYDAAAQSDLRNLMAEMESYFAVNDSYPSDIGALTFQGSSAVTASVASSGSGGYVLQASHDESSSIFCVATDTSAAIDAAGGSPAYGEVYEAAGTGCP